MTSFLLIMPRVDLRHARLEVLALKRWIAEETRAFLLQAGEGVPLGRRELGLCRSHRKQLLSLHKATWTFLKGAGKQVPIPAEPEDKKEKPEKEDSGKDEE
jgi:hypothetical protein